MDKKTIDSKLKTGYIHFRAIIEVLGTPPDYIKKTLKEYVEKIKKSENILFVKEDTSSPKKYESMHSIFTEIELLAVDSKELLYFCFDYMPSSVEIIDPERISIDSHNMTEFLCELQGRLHNVNMELQDMHKKNENLLKNTSAILQNFIRILLSEPKKSSDISKITGIKETELQKILDAMVKEGKITRKGDLFFPK